MRGNMKKDIIISPSILSADFSRLGEEVTAVDKAGADWIHIDVMDGHFVPNLTLGPDIVKSIRPYSKKPFDTHLMIASVDPFVEAFAKAGSDIISFHPEAGPHAHRTVQLIRSYGKKAGIVLNPATPLNLVETMIGDIDLILIMSVNPGYGGQKFISSQLEKIRAARSMIDRSGRDIRLEVDGGINTDTVDTVVQAGADTLVAGSAVFRGHADDYAHNIMRLRSP